MSAMFAFEVGDVSMRSVTFERVMNDVMEELTDLADKEVVNDALSLNCLWVDQIDSMQKPRLLSTLYHVLGLHLESGMHADNDVALLEIGALRDELVRRYPEYLGLQ